MNDQAPTPADVAAAEEAMIALLTRPNPERHGSVKETLARTIAAARAEGRAEGVKEGRAEERKRIAAIVKDNSDAYQRRAVDSTSWYAKETNQEVANVLSELAAELEKEPNK